MTLSFPKEARLRTRRQFQRMAHSKERHTGRWVIIEVCPNRQNTTRLGITVSRRYGKAHVRNRFKRIVREAFRLSWAELRPGLDLNIKPRTAAYTGTTPNIQEDLLRFLGDRGD